MAVSSLRIAVLVTALSLVAMACAGTGGDASDAQSDPADASTESTGANEAGSRAATGAVPPTHVAQDLGRVVVLGEEFLLADVLALGIEPVASTATTAGGFHGISHDTDDIQSFVAHQLEFEQLATLQPDTIIATAFSAQFAGREQLEALGDLLVVEDAGFPAQFEELAGLLGRTDQAAAVLADYDQAVAAADEALADDLAVSLATVYGGQNLALWVDGPINAPATLLDAGVRLAPGADEHPDADNGRTYVSLERVEDLRAEIIVLLQTSDVEGEDAALAAVQDMDLWQGLPAVQADRVVTIDRLGYPGVEGRTRLARELPDLLAPPDAP